MDGRCARRRGELDVLLAAQAGGRFTSRDEHGTSPGRPHAAFIAQPANELPSSMRTGQSVQRIPGSQPVRGGPQTTGPKRPAQTKHKKPDSPPEFPQVSLELPLVVASTRSMDLPTEGETT